MKFTRDGKYALISSPTTGELVVFDAATRKELKRFQVGEAAVGVAVSRDSRRAYVASMATGKVTAVDVTIGEAVAKGQRLVTLEAMKMEHALVAPFDGTVAELPVQTGQQVQVDALLVRVEPSGS